MRQKFWNWLDDIGHRNPREPWGVIRQWICTKATRGL